MAKIYFVSKCYYIFLIIQIMIKWEGNVLNNTLYENGIDSLKAAYKNYDNGESGEHYIRTPVER